MKWTQERRRSYWRSHNRLSLELNGLVNAFLCAFLWTTALLAHRMPLGVLQRVSSQMANSVLHFSRWHSLLIAAQPVTPEEQKGMLSYISFGELFQYQDCDHNFWCRSLHSWKGSLQKSWWRSERFKQIEVFSSGKSRPMQIGGYS